MSNSDEVNFEKIYKSLTEVNKTLKETFEYLTNDDFLSRNYKKNPEVFDVIKQLKISNELRISMEQQLEIYIKALHRDKIFSLNN